MQHNPPNTPLKSHAAAVVSLFLTAFATNIAADVFGLVRHERLVSRKAVEPQAETFDPRGLY